MIPMNIQRDTIAARTPSRVILFIVNLVTKENNMTEEEQLEYQAYLDSRAHEESEAQYQMEQAFVEELIENKDWDALASYGFSPSDLLRLGFDNDEYERFLLTLEPAHA